MPPLCRVVAVPCVMKDCINRVTDFSHSTPEVCSCVRVAFPGFPNRKPVEQVVIMTPVGNLCQRHFSKTLNFGRGRGWVRYIHIERKGRNMYNAKITDITSWRVLSAGLSLEHLFVLLCKMMTSTLSQSHHCPGCPANSL